MNILCKHYRYYAKHGKCMTPNCPCSHSKKCLTTSYESLARRPAAGGFTDGYDAGDDDADGVTGILRNGVELIGLMMTEVLTTGPLLSD